MRRVARWLGGWVARVTGAVLVLIWFGGPASADIITVESEIRIGREAAGEVERQLPMSRDPILINRVERIGRRLAMVSGRPELPFEFHVVDGREINAFALPGGFTYVYRGLLQAVPNDDALAFVMGHEITHATRRHAVKQLRKNALLEIVTIPLRRWLGGGGRGWLQLIMQNVYSRDDESEADHVGLELAAKAGFSPEGGPQAMDTLLKMYGKGGPQILVLLQDHPATEHRLKKLRAQSEQLKSARLAGSKPASPEADLPPKLASPPLPAAPKNPYWPLTPGNRWMYRVTDESGARSYLTVKVIERIPGANLFRVESKIDRNIATVVQLHVTDDAVLRQRGAQWEAEWKFVGDERFRVSEETVMVPHGTHAALRVERLGADKQPVAIGWFVKGLGLVKRQSLATGIVEVLEVCELEN